MKVQLTFDEYDEIVERFEKIQSETFWPTLENIEKMEKDPSAWILFACYLLEMGEEPQTKDENYRKKTLSLFVNNHLELVESKKEVVRRPMYAEG